MPAIESVGNFLASLGEIMLDIIKSIILGFIEGVTEWLPISSTGHLILADEFIKLGMGEEFKDRKSVV